MKLHPDFKGNEAQAAWIMQDVGASDEATLSCILLEIGRGNRDQALSTIAGYRKYSAAKAVELGSRK